MHPANRRRPFAASVDTTNRRVKAAPGNLPACRKPAHAVWPAPIRRASFPSTIDHMASRAASGTNVESVSRRSLFALSAALAATVLTGALAVAGLARRVPAAPTTPRVGQTITPAAATRPARVEPGG